MVVRHQRHQFTSESVIERISVEPRLLNDQMIRVANCPGSPKARRAEIFVEITGNQDCFKLRSGATSSAEDAAHERGLIQFWMESTTMPCLRRWG